MKCEGCGAPINTNVCNFCGTNNKVETEEKINTLIISGDMNDIKISKGSNHIGTLRIKGDMGDYNYNIDGKVILKISGDMNDITFKNVDYIVESDTGDMNTVE